MKNGYLVSGLCVTKMQETLGTPPSGQDCPIMCRHVNELGTLMGRSLTWRDLFVPPGVWTGMGWVQ